jgi:hypothetical protein
MISNNLQKLFDLRYDIGKAIEQKGVNVNTPFTNFPDLINEINSGIKNEQERNLLICAIQGGEITNLKIPDRITKLASYRLSRIKLNNLDLNNVTEMGEGCCENTSLVKLTGNNLIKLGKRALANTQITNLVLPKLEYIEPDSLQGLEDKLVRLFLPSLKSKINLDNFTKLKFVDLGE